MCVFQLVYVITPERHNAILSYMASSYGHIWQINNLLMFGFLLHCNNWLNEFRKANQQMKFVGLLTLLNSWCVKYWD